MRCVVIGFGILGVSTACLLADNGNVVDITDRRSGLEIRSVSKKLKRHFVNYYRSSDMPQVRYDLRVVACSSGSMVVIPATKSVSIPEVVRMYQGQPSAELLSRLWELLKDTPDRMNDRELMRQVDLGKGVPVRHLIPKQEKATA